MRKARRRYTIAQGKTNVMRLLEKAGIPYEPVYYDLGEEEFSGEAVSRCTGIPRLRNNANSQ